MNKTFWLAGTCVIALGSVANAQAPTGSVATTGAATPTAAETPPSDTTGGRLQEIVVTAQKRSENLQKVPLAVSAFSADTLEKQHVSDVSDLTGRVPTLVITQSGSGPSAANVSLRGVFFQDIEKSFEPGVGVVMDGVYLSTSTGQLLQDFDFSQVEVLRGPQGTLFGKNTTGGALNVSRSRPNMEKWTGKARLTFGSFARADGEAVVSGPLIEDKLAVKAAVFSMNDNGAWRATTPTGDTGKKDVLSYSFAIRATPIEALDVQFTYDHTDDKSQLPPFQSYLSPTARQTAVAGQLDGADAPCSNPYLPGVCQPLPQGKNVNRAEDPSRPHYVLNAYTLNAKANLGPVSLVSITSYRKSREDLYTDYDETEYHLFLVRRPSDFHQFTQETRLETNFDGPINFVAGGYYFQSYYNLRQTTFLDLATLLPIPLDTIQSYTGTYTSQNSKSEAAFFQGDWKITHALTLTVGARQSWDQKRFHYIEFSQVPGSFDYHNYFNPKNDTLLRAKFHKFTPRVALRYQLSSNASVYASWSRGYNSGGFNGRGGNPLLLGPYQPEIVNAYEVGFKTELFDRKLRVNGALFQNDFSHKQEEVSVSLPVAPFTGTAVQNVSSARYRGAELEVTALPVRGLNLTGSLGYLNAKYTKFFASLRPGVPAQDLTNLTLRRAPKWTLSGSADYQTEFGAGTIGGNVAVRYISSMELNIVNDPFGHVNPVTKIDASVRYDVKISRVPTEFTVFVKNITDKTPINAFQNAGLGSFVEIGTQDIGRTFGVQAQIKF